MDLSEFISNTSKNAMLASPVSSSMKEPCILGIDEAGRGPVLGPMVYGCCFYPKSRHSDFQALKFADSKTLNEAQREALFENICKNVDYVGWRIIVLSPNYLSNCMLAMAKYNLNTISHDTAAKLVEESLKAGVNIKEVFVDTVGPADKYEALLTSKFSGIKFTVSAKADSKFPSVSAASICAKVARDRALKSWRFVEPLEKLQSLSSDKFGCGYPSDDITKKLLAKTIFDPIFGFPQLVRFSWSTAEKIIEERGVKVVWADDEDHPSRKNLNEYFKTKGNGGVAVRRSKRLFQQLHLQPLV